MPKQDDNKSTADAQRLAAIEIARQRVMASFSKIPENYVEIKANEIKKEVREIVKAEQKQEEAQTAGSLQSRTYEKTYNAARPSPKISEADWKRYHSAWQDYYKRYYEGFYTSATQKTIKELEERNRNASRAVAGIAKNEENRKPTRQDKKDNKEAIGKLRDQIKENASDSARKFKKSRHFAPIIAGLAVVLIFVFLQYNRFFIATVRAYIMPGSELSEIVEINPTISIPVGPEPKLIIPKINVEVPIVFGVGNDYASQNKAMTKGVSHFAVPGAKSVPGQVGNTVLSGHSSNDVFETGAYKFIFAQLERLAKGDTIYINYRSVRYTYTVTKKEVVKPTDVKKLVYETDRPVLTLITCTPVGTAKNRLLVTAEQISPNPDGATEETVETEDNKTTEQATMPSNSPTFFQNVINFFTGN
jgi:LPXTG-site transpeptidase (sortase) family protein